MCMLRLVPDRDLELLRDVGLVGCGCSTMLAKDGRMNVDRDRQEEHQKREEAGL